MEKMELASEREEEGYKVKEYKFGERGHITCQFPATSVSEDRTRALERVCRILIKAGN